MRPLGDEIQSVALAGTLHLWQSQWIPVEAAARLSACPTGLSIGRGRRNFKFRLDMHSISAGYRPKALCASRPSVFDQPSSSALYSGCWAA
jgi:hypothetical protein